MSFQFYHIFEWNWTLLSDSLAPQSNREGELYDDEAQLHLKMGEKM